MTRHRADDPASAEHAERSRLRWRCRRGMRELDVLLERWLDRCWTDADARRRGAFERVLASEDDALWAWVTERSRPDDPELAALVDELIGASRTGDARRSDG